MPPRRKKQKSKAATEKKEANFADDEKADYFADVDAEVDEDTKGPEDKKAPARARFSEELQKQLARKRHLEELKKVFTTGKRLEAKDIGTDVWYPAKVVEYDDLDLEVLIHFENWSQRYDEWISIDSPRLRVLPDESVQTKTTKIFNVGDKVMATWTDSRKYPAEIKEVLPEEKYKVLFYDGFLKVIKGTRITKLEATASTLQLPVMEAAATSNPSNIMEPPGLNTSRTNLEPKYSKEERRLRMRKLNIAELFQTNRRRKGTKGHNSNDSESGSETEEKLSRKPTKNNGGRTLVSESGNSGAEYRRKSKWRSRLLGNDLDTCDRVEARRRTRRTSSSSLAGSDTDTKARTQGSEIKTKIMRRRTSSSPLVASDTDNRHMTQSMSSSSVGGSDTDAKASDADIRMSAQRTSSSSLASRDIEDGKGTQKTPLHPVVVNDDTGPRGGNDRETRSVMQRTSLSPFGGSDRGPRSMIRRTSSSPCLGSDLEARINTRSKSSSPTKARGQVQTQKQTSLGSHGIKPRNRSRTQNPFGGSDIVTRSRSLSRMGSELSESDIELGKNYRKCVSEGEIDTIRNPTGIKQNRKRKRRKSWGKVPKKKRRTESFTDLSSYSSHSATESEMESALVTKGWSSAMQVEKQSTTVMDISGMNSTVM